MADRARWPLAHGGVVHTVFSDAADGDLAVGVAPADLDRRRGALAPLPWTWLQQVHGADVVRVALAGARAGSHADAAITTAAAAVLAVQVADCAPVLLWGPIEEGAAVLAVHAGWRGVRAGVLGAAVAAGEAAGVDPSALSWTLGPCICAEHYEFGGAELDDMVRRFGPEVASRTAWGSPALDLRAAVAASLGSAGVCAPPVGPVPVCTFESPRHWSFRAGQATARQVGAIWWEAP